MVLGYVGLEENIACLVVQKFIFVKHKNHIMLLLELEYLYLDVHPSEIADVGWVI